MRKVKKEWIEYYTPQRKKIPYEEALNDLQEIYPGCTRDMIDGKLSQGIKLGNGRGTTYQVLVIKKEGGKTR